MPGLQRRRLLDPEAWDRRVVRDRQIRGREPFEPRVEPKTLVELQKKPSDRRVRKLGDDARFVGRQRRRHVDQPERAQGNRADDVVARHRRGRARAEHAHAVRVLLDASHRRAVAEARAESLRERDRQPVVAALDVIDAVRIDVGDVRDRRGRNRASERRRAALSRRGSRRCRDRRQRIRRRGSLSAIQMRGRMHRRGGSRRVLRRGDDGVRHVAKNQQRGARIDSVAPKVEEAATDHGDRAGRRACIRQELREAHGVEGVQGWRRPIRRARRLRQDRIQRRLGVLLEPIRRRARELFGREGDRPLRAHLIVDAPTREIVRASTLLSVWQEAEPKGQREADGVGVRPGHEPAPASPY